MTAQEPLLRKVDRTIREHSLWEEGEAVLVACSGGPDSSALAVLVSELRPAFRGEVVIAHVDHGLRAGSGQEAERVQTLAGRLGTAFCALRVTVPSGDGGLMERARTARYAALERAARDFRCARIAVGHTRSDQAETVLHRLLRGAGLEGLGGIPIRRGAVIRPLLWASRFEILAFLQGRALTFFEDPSNLSANFLRVRLRHEVLPRLEDLTPGIEERLSELADDAQLAAVELREQIQPFIGQGVAAMKACPVRLRRWAVRELLRGLRGDLRGLAREHYRSAEALVFRGPDPGEVHLPGGAFCRAGNELSWRPHTPGFRSG